MYSLATVRTLFLALRSELCSIGTGVTEKVTKTFHSFLGSSSPVAWWTAGVREPMGASCVGFTWVWWWSSCVVTFGFCVPRPLRSDHLGWNEWSPCPHGFHVTWWVDLLGKWMVTVSLSPGEWIHLSWVGHRRMVWKGYRPRVLAGGHASAWLSPLAWPCTGSPKVPSGTNTTS